MSTASSTERRLCKASRASARSLATLSMLLAAAAASFVKPAFAQMEHRHAMVHAGQAQAVAPVLRAGGPSTWYRKGGAAPDGSAHTGHW